MDSKPTGQEPISNPQVDLAIERTILALDRTHLAWIRTAMALFASGYAVDAFLEVFHHARLESGRAWVATNHITGVSLATLATLGLALETFMYVRRILQLTRQHSSKKFRLPTAAFVSLSIVFVGLVVLILIFQG